MTPRNRASERDATRTPRTSPRIDPELRTSQVIVRARAQDRCERCGTSTLTAGSQVHHRHPRKVGGARRNPWINLPGNLLNLCPGCHEWIEHHREDARDCGWLVPMGATISRDAPMLHALHGWVYLTDDGGYTPTQPPT